MFALSVAAASQLQTVSLRNEQDFGSVQYAAIEPLARLETLPAIEGALQGGKIGSGIRASLRDAAVAAQVQAAVRAPFPSLFGTQSILVGNTAIMQRWRNILAESADKNILLDCMVDADDFCNLPRVAAMRTEVKRLQSAPRAMQVRAVNEFVNRNLSYASDLSVYGVTDYWASLREFLHHGRGDCEDFAIAKLWMLAALGVPLDSIRMVVLRDQVTRQDHAVLAVDHAGAVLVLDNRSAVVRVDAEIRHYRPYYSLSASGSSWVHSVPTGQGQPVTAARTQPHREARLN
ncbi:MAG: transglutaminase-like cysteine peptidase [Xanthobacteraceae bacterium]